MSYCEVCAYGPLSRTIYAIGRSPSDLGNNNTAAAADTMLHDVTSRNEAAKQGVMQSLGLDILVDWKGLRSRLEAGPPLKFISKYIKVPPIFSEM